MKKLLLPLLFVATAVTAQVVTPYTDPTLFDGAAGATTTINFTGLNGQYPSGFTISGVTFQGINPSFQGQTQDSVFEVVDGANLGAGAGNSVVYSLNDHTSTVFTTLITLPGAGVLSFATDIKIDDPNAAGTLKLQLFSGNQSLGTFTTSPFAPQVAGNPSTGNYTQFQFIGFTSDTPITSVQVGQYAGTGIANVVLDNVQFGTAVPEPSTWAALIGGGALLLLAERRRRRQAR